MKCKENKVDNYLTYCVNNNNEIKDLLTLPYDIYWSPIQYMSWISRWFLSNSTLNFYLRKLFKLNSGLVFYTRNLNDKKHVIFNSLTIYLHKLIHMGLGSNEKVNLDKCCLLILNSSIFHFKFILKDFSCEREKHEISISRYINDMFYHTSLKIII